MSDDPNNLRDLAPIMKSDAIVLWRRRLGWSQTRMAHELGVSMRKLTGWEYREQADSPDYRKALYPLKDHEVAFLYRRHCGVSVNELALDLGCTAYWVTRIERGREPTHVGRLLEYWEC